MAVLATGWSCVLVLFKVWLSPCLTGDVQYVSNT